MADRAMLDIALLPQGIGTDAGRTLCSGRAADTAYAWLTSPWYASVAFDVRSYLINTTLRLIALTIPTYIAAEVPG